MRAVCLVTVCLVSLVLGVGGSDAAPPLIPPGKAKFPPPENVVCPVVGTEVVVAWDLVADANAYQVEWAGILADGTVVAESDFVLMPPATMALATLASLAVHVRALPAPHRAGGPLAGSGPKGGWSAPCVVEIPALP